MRDEDFTFRRGPATAYRPSGAVLSLPVNALEATLGLLQRSGRRESCVFWYGTRDRETGLSAVRAVLAPVQTMRPGNYAVSAAAMSQMVTLVTAEDWKPLAQIHSHPGKGVRHSAYDDEMASSRRALSIVFPFYGHWHGRWPTGVGVHEHQNDYWHTLLNQDAARRVEVVEKAPLLIKDLRR
jgi:proteasome lid subunit RPN8/RPN11